MHKGSNLSEALKCFDSVIELNSNDFQAWYYKGTIKSQEKSDLKALECYDKALSINPNHLDSHKMKGLSLTRLHLYNDAINSYNFILENKPDDTIVCELMAELLLVTGNYKRALLVINHALSIDNTSKWSKDIKQSIIAKLNEI